MSTTPHRPTSLPKKGLALRLLGLFNSVWLGIGLLTAIFLFTSIGSALAPNALLPSPREFFEKTEMEWFAWWPFNLLIALLCTNLAVVTIRRIPLRITTLGVWMIHSGILLLCGGSVYYFARKVEGDTPVFRRRVAIDVPGAMGTRLLCRPDNEVRVAGADGPYAIQIGRIDPTWSIPQGDHQGEQAYMVELDVSTPQGRFERRLVAGHPDLTSDRLGAQLSARITHPSADSVALLECREGAQAQLRTPDGDYSFRISNLMPDWPILSGEDQGKRAFSVQVEVSAPTGTFTRQLLDGFPQYTEDVLPGGRAVKVTGRKLVDEVLEMSLERVAPSPSEALGAGIATRLEYEPQPYAFLASTAALFARPVGAESWTQRPIRDLPHYQDYIRDAQDVANPDAEKHLGGLNLPLDPPDGEDPLSGFGVRVTGFLNQAHPRASWEDGGAALYPVARLRFEAGSGDQQSIDLAALDPQRRMALQGRVEFLWMESAKEIDAFLARSEPQLGIEVPEAEIRFETAMETPAGDPEQTAFIEIEGTSFAYRVMRRHDHLQVQDGRVLSIAVVEIRTPEGVITRWVADDPASTQDMVAEVHGAEGHNFKPPDARIVTTYRPPSGRMVSLVAGPGRLHVLVDTPMTGRRQLKAQVGTTLELAEGVHLTITELITHARAVVRPFVVPRVQRQRDAGLSMVQIEVSRQGWLERLWLPYNFFALPSAEYAVPGKILYRPQTLKLPDGRQVELMYSRQRFSLPAPVVLDDFTLLTHAGGLIGRNQNIRDYVSQLRFLQPDGNWSPQVQMSLNAPASWNGYYFFQSTWDTPVPDDPGMNYTGCGIGTRDGVYIQLLGTIIAVLGMIYTFYVKPIIIRRQRLSVYQQAELQQSEMGRGNGAGHPQTERALRPEAVGSSSGREELEDVS